MMKVIIIIIIDLFIYYIFFNYLFSVGKNPEVILKSFDFDIGTSNEINLKKYLGT